MEILITNVCRPAANGLLEPYLLILGGLSVWIVTDQLVIPGNTPGVKSYMANSIWQILDHKIK